MKGKNIINSSELVIFYNMNNPIVSIYMPTYYHEAYIEQAIESVLKQKTTYSYEIVISDDCSQDKTQELIRKYADMYPFIRANFNSSNIGLTANIYKSMCMGTGKYIVGLAGDDYWIDDNKLQKQVDFLENNSDYLAVCTRIEGRYDNDVEAVFATPKITDCDKEATLSEFLQGKNIPLNGMMMRNVLIDNPGLFAQMPKISHYIDDLSDNLFVLMTGRVYVLPDITVAYRMRKATTGDHNFNSANVGLASYEKHIELLNNLDEYLEGKIDLFVRYKLIVSFGLRTAIKGFKYRRFKKCYKTIPLKYRKRKLWISALKS